MTDTDPADAELADAMDSIQSTGEDWRSRERATETAQNEPAASSATAAPAENDEETDNG